MNENNVRNDETEIDLRELISVYLKKWWLIAIVALSCAAIAFGITKVLITPKYQSDASIFILDSTTSITSMADIQIGTALSNDFVIIAKSKPVIDYSIEQIEKQSGRKLTRNEITSSLAVTNPNNTRILKFTVTNTDPEKAALIANAVSSSTAKRMAQITGKSEPTIVETAEVSKKPVSPSLKKNMIIGLLLGIVLTCGVLTVHHLLNDNIKTEEDVEKYIGVPTLATIPLIKGRDSKKEELKQQKEDMKREKKD